MGRNAFKLRKTFDVCVGIRTGLLKQQIYEKVFPKEILCACGKMIDPGVEEKSIL